MDLDESNAITLFATPEGLRFQIPNQNISREMQIQQAVLHSGN